jgi:hypothetical protein
MKWEELSVDPSHRRAKVHRGRLEGRLLSCVLGIHVLSTALTIDYINTRQKNEEDQTIDKGTEGGESEEAGGDK